MTHRIPQIALTGGIASGKSLVANEFAKLGVPIIDTDGIARAMVAPGQPALLAIVAHFGPAILAADGTLNRKLLRERIFQNPAERQALEAILHPAIRAEQIRLAATAGGPYQLHVIPLLAETGNRHLYDRVLVVDCPPEVQLQRLIARDGISAQFAERMIAAQASREQRFAIADDLIDNARDMASLAARVAQLHQTYLKGLANKA